jgi:hypothetical protein
MTNHRTIRHEFDQHASGQLSADPEAAISHLADHRLVIADHTKHSAFEHAQLAQTAGDIILTLDGTNSDLFARTSDRKW